MTKLVTIDDVLKDFSYEATDEIKKLIASYLDMVTEELSVLLGTPLARSDYTDYFWYDERSRANALPYTQFNLKAGFVSGPVQVDYAPMLDQFDPDVARVKGQPVPVSPNDLLVNAENGTVRCMDESLQTNSFYRIRYTAGFTATKYVVNGITNSYLYEGTPEWLRQGGKVLTSQLLRDHFAPNTRSKQVDKRLNDILQLKARRFGPSCRPL
jgi:hypothetical protein